jgi:bifunctional non-homologous end joining protein LigD
MKLPLMLAQTTEKPFTRKGWIFELKYDGYRILAARDEDGEGVLRSRNGHDLTKIYPEIARVMTALPYQDLVLDGELVVLDEAGRPTFGRLQKRAQLKRRMDIERATVTLPASFFAFDLLGFEGFDLRSLPLVKRKELLRKIVPSEGAVRYADHVAEQGEAMYAGVKDMSLEGIMAKKADAPYRGGRSAQWQKIKVDKTGDFVVCGYTAPQGGRNRFGALHLGVYENDQLVYTGRVGTGFSDAQLEEFGKILAKLRRKTPPCRGPVPRSGKHFWVKPELVVEVRYKTVTEDGHLRHPAFLRPRDDKGPRDCEREPTVVLDEPDLEMEKEDTGPERMVRLTNLEKVFWPQEGYTKGDLIEYYKTVSEWILPYLRNRPLVLTRYPNGIEGKNFYQKNAPDFIPGWVRTESIWSGSSEREIDYLVCDDEEMLVYIINSGAIPLHLWSSRIDSIQNPDWCILDLDPKGAPFPHVVKLARAIHKLCDDIGLPNFAKTSGSTGLHVLIPLGGQCTYEQSRTLGHLIARVIEKNHGDISTTARVIAARQGKVYLDFLQNRHGQLLVAPYCVRPLPGAPVSAPLDWREVNAKLEPQKFTMRNLRGRLKRKKTDPLLAVLTEKPDLVSALARLAKLTE